MKVLKTIAVITVGAAAGMLIANKLTDGAVVDALTDLYHTIVDKGEAAVEAVAETAEAVTDAAGAVEV